jgi:ATP-dependent DNA helicase RecG
VTGARRPTASAPPGEAGAADAAVDLLGPIELAGIGPKRRAALAAAGIACWLDLLLLAPAELRPVPEIHGLASARRQRGRLVRVAGRVAGQRLARLPKRGTLLRVTLADGDARLDALYFNQPWQREAFPLDRSVRLEGRLIDAQGPALAAPRQLSESEWRLPAGQLLPVYAGVDGLSAAQLQRLCLEARELHGQQLAETLDARGLERLGLPALPEALRRLMQADRLALGVSDVESLSAAGLLAARRRLSLEPLLGLVARLLARRERRAQGRAAPLAPPQAERAALAAAFPFTPTDGQRLVLGELERDLARPVPMRRLLQGDVGSGKTLIGLYACALAAKAGRQALFLAPTELLAEQHLSAARLFLERVGISAGVLTGSLKSGARRALLARLADGRLQVCFGTHALLSPAVQLANPALAVIDEQHRFGVEQRAALLDKGEDLHALLMSATPIPRTLALSLYGDLDVSVLRELPPGRQRIETKLVLRAERGRVLATFAERLAAGEQGFFVAPRIESSELGRGAEELHAELLATPLARFGIELVHGRLASPEREARLERFRRGASRLLVGTTVIEVGLDVPAATLIAIEGAERFGLAQLHQLRGRVGRGQRGQPWCFLIPERFAAPRLRLLESLADGFALAEQDLSERGMGDLFGARQAGENQEGLAGDVQEADGLDAALLLFAREALERDPAAQSRYLAAELRRRSSP